MHDLILHNEINSLDNYKLFDWGDYDVYAAPTNKIPKIIQQIGVLREKTFRAVGEGTGKCMDLDQYDLNQVSFSSWEQMLRKKSEDSLRKHGIVPWHIPIVYQRLVQAFLKKDTLQIIKLSAELGHYVADSHVPLHTSSNYDGQKTGQGGLHSFWESRIPEILGNQLDQFSGPATFIPDVQHCAWTWVLASHKQLPLLFSMAYKVSAELKEGEKYSFELSSVPKLSDLSHVNFLSARAVLAQQMNWPLC